MHMHHPQRHPPAPTAASTDGKAIHWARQYDGVVKLLTLGRESALRQETIRLAAIPRGAAVLDVGCGTGTLTLLAKAATGTDGRVQGIDPSPQMITAAREKALQSGSAVDFQTGVIEALPFADASFEVVLSSLMFHHLPPDLKERGLQEVFRVLKPGGRLTIVDMTRPRSWMQRLTLVALAHHGSTSDVGDLLPLMEQIGYGGCQAGSLSLGVIGYAQGSRPI